MTAAAIPRIIFFPLPLDSSLSAFIPPKVKEGAEPTTLLAASLDWGAALSATAPAAELVLSRLG